jgi:hypothetical protein
VASSVDRILDLSLPTMRGDAAQVMRRRVIGGAALVGLLVAVLSIASTVAFNGGLGAVPMVAFAVGCAIALLASRAGLPTGLLRVYCLALLCAFFAVECLQTTALDWAQLKWLALLPMITLFLCDPAPSLAHGRTSLVPLWWGVGLAVALAAGIVGANLAGWTAGIPQPPAAVADVAGLGLVDHALFVASVAGLVAMHQRSLRKATDEVRVLRSLLSMCSWCRRIGDDEEGWVTVERFMEKKGDAQLTHGICPDCARKTFGEEL